jgi:NAD(P)-dependent dehydrogenase (short-subunit alcohol dehydrogenase family)
LEEQGVQIVSTYFESSERVAVSDQPRTTWVEADIRERSALNKVLRTAVNVLPAIDLVVNTVGGSHSLALNSITYEAWRDSTDLNLYGPLLAAQVFGLHMKRNGGGAIVNISSVAAIRPLAKGHDYVAAKAGLVGLTKSLSLAFAPEVVVNAIAPGWITTDRRTRNPDNQPDVLERIPLRRFGTADDIADAVLFLANPKGYITGQTIVLDGGYTV